MNDQQLYELLKKQQKRALTPPEEQLLEDWFNGLDHTPGKAAPVLQMKARIWTVLRDKLRLEEPRIRRLPRIVYAVAASVLVVMVCAVLYLLPRKRSVQTNRPAIALTTVQAPHGRQLRVGLPDGSAVWLNGDAVMDYPAVFDSSRDVYLRDGEAFFEVASDAAKPFIVHSRNLHTQVLGTSFDIRASPDQYMVAVASGKVKVYYSGDRKAREISHMLGAGQRLMTDSAGDKSVVDSLDRELCRGWTSHSYHLKDVSLTGIAFCMESIYGVRIIIKNKEAATLTFTTIVSNKDRMKDLLDRLSLAGDFHYTIHGDTVIIH